MRNMRRADRQMENNEAVELLKKGEYGILSTVSSDNEPYGVPLSYVFENGVIFLHCATEGSKLDNIAANKAVCFTVVGKTKVLPDKFSTEYESVIVFGKASIVTGEEKVLGLKKLVDKYSPEFLTEGDAYIERAKERTVVIKIIIESITGKYRMP